MNIATYCTKTFGAKASFALRHYGAAHGHTVTEHSKPFNPSKFTCVIMFEQSSKKCMLVAKACEKTRTPVYWMQLGLLRVVPPYRVGPLSGYLTLGEHWSQMIGKGVDYKMTAVGSLKTDFLDIQSRPRVDATSCVVIDQPVEVQGGKNAAIPSLSVLEYVTAVRKACPSNMIVRVLPHYSRKMSTFAAVDRLSGVKVIKVNLWDVLANAGIVVTMFSTLGLECAGAGINVVSFIPAKYISERTLNMADYGIPTYSSEKALATVFGKPVVIDKNKMLPFLSNVMGPSASDRIFKAVRP